MTLYCRQLEQLAQEGNLAASQEVVTAIREAYEQAYPISWRMV